MPIPLLPVRRSRPRAERQIDGESVLERAAETSAEMPDLDDDAPASRRIERLERKSQKAHERLDAAREKLPTKKVLKKERVFDEETGKGKTRLYFEDELKVPKGQSKLQFEADKTVRKVGQIRLPLASTAKSMRWSRKTPV